MLLYPISASGFRDGADVWQHGLRGWGHWWPFIGTYCNWRAGWSPRLAKLCALPAFMLKLDPKKMVRDSLSLLLLKQPTLSKADCCGEWHRQVPSCGGWACNLVRLPIQGDHHHHPPRNQKRWYPSASRWPIRSAVAQRSSLSWWLGKQRSVTTKPCPSLLKPKYILFSYIYIFIIICQWVDDNQIVFFPLTEIHLEVSYFALGIQIRTWCLKGCHYSSKDCLGE